MPRTLFRLRARTLLFLSLLGASGCSMSPLAKRTAAFSTAAGATTLHVSDAYKLIERTYSEAQVSTLVDDYDTKGFDPKSVHTLIPEGDRIVRSQILDGLTQYASLLADISSNRPLTDVDAEAKNLGGAIQSFSADQLSAAHFSSTEVNLAATALDALGRALIERRRRRELPAILSKMQQPIETICSLLTKDIGGSQTSGLRNLLHVQYGVLIINQQTYIDDNEASMSPSEKRAEIRRLPRLASAELQGDQALAATQSALADLASAHTALVQAAKEKDAPDFRIRLARLIGSAQQLKDFYSSLPTS